MAETKGNRTRLYVAAGGIALAAAGALTLWLMWGTKRGETPIIISDTGSIKIESQNVDWQDYDFYPGGASQGDALTWTSRKEKGRIETITAGANTVDCRNVDNCVIVAHYKNSSGQEATVLARSGKKGSDGKGLTIVSTIPYQSYNLIAPRTLESKDPSYDVTSAYVSTGGAPVALCGSTGKCVITLDFK
jgi:hypothetical protein